MGQLTDISSPWRGRSSALTSPFPRRRGGKGASGCAARCGECGHSALISVCCGGVPAVCADPGLRSSAPVARWTLTCTTSNTSRPARSMAVSHPFDRVDLCHGIGYTRRAELDRLLLLLPWCAVGVGKGPRRRYRPSDRVACAMDPSWPNGTSLPSPTGTRQRSEDRSLIWQRHDTGDQVYGL
jgi:hypothetical protein